MFKARPSLLCSVARHKLAVDYWQLETAHQSRLQGQAVQEECMLDP